MTPNLRFVGYVFAVAAAHFLVTLLLVSSLAGGAMGRIPDHGMGPVINAPISAAEQVGTTILQVLLLPILPLMSRLPADGLLSLAPFILNSFLWGVAAALFVRFVPRRIRR